MYKPFRSGTQSRLLITMKMKPPENISEKGEKVGNQ